MTIWPQHAHNYVHSQFNWLNNNEYKHHNWDKNGCQNIISVSLVTKHIDHYIKYVVQKYRSYIQIKHTYACVCMITGSQNTPYICISNFGFYVKLYSDNMHVCSTRVTSGSNGLQTLPRCHYFTTLGWICTERLG